MNARSPDGESGQSGPSADERDVGWGGRDWEDDDPEREDRDLERLRAERPPHHEEREG